MTRDRGWALALLVSTVTLGIGYIVVTPPGLPYDEPSHWLNVQFYLEHHRLPVVGEPGVTYEAQMGPVAYVLLSLVAAPWWPASPETAFYAARSLGLLELVALMVVAWRLTRKVFPDRPPAPLLAAALLGLNPMLLAVSTSIQNDVLALLLAASAVDVATSAAPWPPRRGLLVGLLVGLALLTKLTVWPVALVLGCWLLWHRRVAAAAAYGLGVLLVTGWWFLRNLDLYGDLIGDSGTEAAGYDFPALGWHPWYLVRSATANLWLPVEYVRNVVAAPLVVEVVVVLLTLAGLVGAGLAARTLGTTGRLLAAVAALALVGGVVVITTIQGVSFRFAHAGLLAWFSALGGLATYRRSQPVAVVLVVAVVALDVWFLLELRALPDPGLLDPGSSPALESPR